MVRGTYLPCPETRTIELALVAVMRWSLDNEEALASFGEEGTEALVWVCGFALFGEVAVRLVVQNASAVSGLWTQCPGKDAGSLVFRARGSTAGKFNV